MACYEKTRGGPAVEENLHHDRYIDLIAVTRARPKISAAVSANYRVKRR